MSRWGGGKVPPGRGDGPPVAFDDPGPFKLQEETTLGHPEPSDPRCKDYDPNPYVVPPPVCTDYVHYRPCPLANGMRRRDVRPWWQRFVS